MIAGLLVALILGAVIGLLDPGLWLMLVHGLEREDGRNGDLGTWERLGL